MRQVRSARKAALGCETVRVLGDDLILCAWFAIEMNDVKGIFVHLFNDEADRALAPDIACVSYIDL